MLYYLGFMFWYQDYPQHGTLINLMFGSTLFISAVVAFGLFLTSFFRTRERAFQLILVTSLPLFFISNLSWPEVSSPAWLVWISKVLPSTAGINLMVKITHYGEPLSSYKKEILILVMIILVFGGLGWWRYYFYKAGSLFKKYPPLKKGLQAYLKAFFCQYRVKLCPDNRLTTYTYYVARNTVRRWVSKESNRFCYVNRMTTLR